MLTLVSERPLLTAEIENCISSPGSNGVAGLRSRPSLLEVERLAGASMTKVVGSSLPGACGLSVLIVTSAVVTVPWVLTTWPLTGEIPRAERSATVLILPLKFHFAVAPEAMVALTKRIRPVPLTPPEGSLWLVPTVSAAAAKTTSLGRLMLSSLMVTGPFDGLEMVRVY